MPGRCWFLAGAAYRNRTDDLRITRRIRAVHGYPDSHIRPVRLASQSTCVRAGPGSLLANPLAGSVPGRQSDGPHLGHAAQRGRPCWALHARRVRRTMVGTRSWTMGKRTQRSSATRRRWFGPITAFR
jgi:hypothetical protein